MKHSSLLVFAVFSAPAFAEVKSQTDAGFSVVHVAEVSATPDQIWKRLVAPKEYWSKSHSWSGSVAGFSIDPKAGGCFCELIQETGTDGKTKTIGSVEHMRVIFASPGKVLRMQGALGPLQAEAVLGTLTVAIEPIKDGGRTKLSFSYVVGGYMRYKMTDIAPSVDKVIGEQFASLIKPFAKPDEAEEKVSDWKLDLDGIAEEPADKPDSVEESSKAAAAEGAVEVKASSKSQPTAKPLVKAKPKSQSRDEATDGR
jgi:hypothetical protein